MSALLDSKGREPHVRVTVVEADGSSPREVGASMAVMTTEIGGTIGGGALEHQAIARARTMLSGSREDRWLRTDEKLALGPSLGQCCGGAVRLLYERIGEAERDTLEQFGQAVANGHGLVLRPLATGTAPRLVTDRKDIRGLPMPVARAVADMVSGLRPQRPVLVRDWLVEPARRSKSGLYLYGAGHVGRAVIAAAGLVDGLDIVWVDTARDRFPPTIPGDIRVEIAADPARSAGLAPGGCYHLIMTYSHAIDLSICHALLQRNDFTFLGLIGSMSKRARFLSRLRQAGIVDAALQRLICPIGIGGITGKEPGVIALSVMTQIVRELEARRTTDEARRGAISS